MANLRVALLGGSEQLRASKRTVLDLQGNIQIVFDSDGHGVMPQDFRTVTFDVAIIEQRLGSMSAFEFVKVLHSLSAMDGEEVGRILIASQFYEIDLRLNAIEAGAVDCVFVSDGFESLIEKVNKCEDSETDFAIRELLPELNQLEITQEGFQSAAVAMDTLDKTETKVVKAFCQLKSDSEIAVSASVSKVKVRNTLKKVQKLLTLDTRSQLLLRMYRLGALAL